MELETKRKINRFAAWAAGVGIVLTALGVGTLLFWAFAREDVLTVNNAPFPSRTITNDSDRYVILTVDYCKNVDVAGRLRMSFVSKTNEIFLPQVDEKLPKGCKISDAPIAIPKNLPADTYKIRFRVTYNLNPLKQNIPSEFESREFQVK